MKINPTGKCGGNLRHHRRRTLLGDAIKDEAKLITVGLATRATLAGSLHKFARPPPGGWKSVENAWFAFQTSVQQRKSRLIVDKKNIAAPEKFKGIVSAGASFKS